MRSNKSQQQPRRNCPYSLNVFQETYKSAAHRLIDFFTITHLKKYIDYDNKTKFHKQLIQEILRQLREFLKNKAMRQYENTCKQENFEQIMALYDEIYFRDRIMKKLKAECNQQNEKQIFNNIQVFQAEDVQDQILNQLQAKLVKIYASI